MTEEIAKKRDFEIVKFQNRKIKKKKILFSIQ